MAEHVHTPAEQAPPAHILASFQVPSATPVKLESWWSDGWRCDRAVISHAEDPARAAWIAGIMNKVRPAGVSVARPIFSSDGRFSVSGWRARSFLSGHPAPRFDEMAAASLRLNEALRGEQRPAFLYPPQVAGEWGEVQIFAAADQAAFDDDPTRWVTPVLDPQSVPREDVAWALAKAAQLAELREELTEPDQLVHADVAGTIIFDGAADPIITDFVPAWHPAGWSAAVLIVDTMAWGNAPDALLDRWAHIPDFLQLVLRAVLYRLFVHVMLPSSTPAAWQGLARVSDVVAAKVEEHATDVTRG
ncbi:MAG TPA: TIGR02569 family protein [Candidatus Corynebacterium gallistercoris]|uniref:TIGR02569 family protein n=1 Tax=Candidatus Corynebacterium gallistercoris TaxID=2838530 RepID=A0A9D1RZL6_9CORY|nr:TIGR02569 family protein [Candidatus Corynebacterium gallistercoris]